MKLPGARIESAPSGRAKEELDEEWSDEADLQVRESDASGEHRPHRAERTPVQDDDDRPRRPRPQGKAVGDEVDGKHGAPAEDQRQAADAQAPCSTGFARLLEEELWCVGLEPNRDAAKLLAGLCKGAKVFLTGMPATLQATGSPRGLNELVTTGRRFDLVLGVGYWLDGPERSRVLEPTWIEMLKFLLAQPALRASNSEILRHLKRTTAYRGDDPKNVKKLAQRFRKTFELRLGQVVCGRTGVPGGGQRLVLDDAPVP